MTSEPHVVFSPTAALSEPSLSMTTSTSLAGKETSSGVV